MLNLIDEDVYFELSGAVLTKDFKKVFDISRQIYENGWNFIDFMDGLVEHFRNIMTVIAYRKDRFYIETAEVYRMQVS
jgi:DNA polymerase III subunit gamma/tau